MYIERANTLRQLKDSKEDDPTNTAAWRIASDCAISIVESEPAADVAPVVYGEWVNVVHALVDTTGVCTKCGKQAVWRTKNKPYIICPNCGAKMIKE